ncbi:T9SS type A sorting domain-containing protein [Chitinophaga horti]|uniref:T9SS type A sorting domain-containing protein n=1 Tax=Chitinophaga horti TaxID=2920382 RepID=A0ABY6J218_9BACT|nr:T9SS type A sorting domain-containing protein [Chitinophaga horti]UYQ93675.1 T9SS type A sorting domain-containing protein [Chitinophaga horti]
MKKTFTRYLLFAGFALLLSLPARSQILVRQVNSPAGGSATAGNVSFEYTIGEVAVLTLANGDMLTEGFNQPEVIPHPGQGVNPLINAIIFPNPAVANVKIQFDLLAAANIQMLFINSAGQVVYQEARRYAQGKILITLPVNRFAAGIYTVMLKAGGHVFMDKLIVQ